MRKSRVCQIAFAGLVLLGGVLPSSFAEEPFSIEQVMSAPFPSGLVAAPKGGGLAWVQNDEGKRNIWVAFPPKYEGRQLTTYGDDDGQVVTSLRFVGSGSDLVYVRGGAPNRSGEIPNPESLPNPVARELWIVSTEDGKPRKLGAGSSPIVAPDGSSIVFLRKGQVWSMSLDEKDAKAEKLFHIRGRAESPTWSPDGSKIAFESDRGDHAFIGVFDLAEKTVRYLDPSVDRDAEPVWSPDGRRIAFGRLARHAGRLPFMAMREGEPWSIRVADVESGRGHEIWRADEGAGSVFRGIEAERQLFWGSGDHLVFPWEKDGWTHLYSLKIGESEATILTPGEFEVEHAALTSDRLGIIFSSNQGDIDRRHLWRVKVSGGKPRAITEGTGIEWAPVSTSDDGAIAYLASDATTPAHARIKVGTKASRAMAPGSRSESFPAHELVVPAQVIFPGADGMPIHGQLFLPPDGTTSKKSPAVLFFHGGSRRQMFLGWHNRGYYHNAYAFNQFLASRGFVVLSVNYRSGIGYGMEFREALNYGARGASEFNDVLGAGLYLAARDDVDSERIGLWGGSYGGYLTALGLARASDLFAAGVDVHGVHDWNVVIRNFMSTYDPIQREEAARLAYESSPMASVTDWRSPVLLIHGDDDRNVPFSETVDLVEALRRQEVEFELLIFPDDVHSFLLHRNWIEAFQASADFLERKLKPE